MTDNNPEEFRLAQALTSPESWKAHTDGAPMPAISAETLGNPELSTDGLELRIARALKDARMDEDPRLPAASALLARVANAETVTVIEAVTTVLDTDNPNPDQYNEAWETFWQAELILRDGTTRSKRRQVEIEDIGPLMLNGFDPSRLTPGAYAELMRLRVSPNPADRRQFESLTGEIPSKFTYKTVGPHKVVSSEVAAKATASTYFELPTELASLPEGIRSELGPYIDVDHKLALEENLAILQTFWNLVGQKLPHIPDTVAADFEELNHISNARLLAAYQASIEDLATMGQSLLNFLRHRSLAPPQIQLHKPFEFDNIRTSIQGVPRIISPPDRLGLYATMKDMAPDREGQLAEEGSNNTWELRQCLPETNARDELGLLPSEYLACMTDRGYATVVDGRQWLFWLEDPEAENNSQVGAPSPEIALHSALLAGLARGKLSSGIIETSDRMLQYFNDIPNVSGSSDQIVISYGAQGINLDLRNAFMFR